MNFFFVQKVHVSTGSRDLMTAEAVPVIVAWRSKVRNERQVEVRGARSDWCVPSVKCQSRFLD